MIDSGHTSKQQASGEQVASKRLRPSEGGEAKALAVLLFKALEQWIQTPVPAAAHETGEWTEVQQLRRAVPRIDLRASEESQLAAIAESDYANRRRRDRYLPASIFSEPAWDILLDLYVQNTRKRSVSVQSLCIASAAPATTALRWIEKLTSCRLIERKPSVSDRRVVHVVLTAQGMEQMENYLRDRLSQTHMITSTPSSTS